MLADPSISIAGHTITTFQLLVTGALLLCAAAILLAYRRELKLSVRPSATTDEIFDQLVRIANAVERLASQASDSAIAEASRRAERASRERATVQEPHQEPVKAAQGAAPEQEPEQHHVAYSMFGR